MGPQSPSHNTVQNTLDQLSQVRAIALGNPSTYASILPSVFAVIGDGNPLEQRRWGADFLAEAFASPVVPDEDKEKLSLQALDTLKGYLLGREDEDANVVKSAVQMAASVYPFVMRHTITNAADHETWQKMASIKSSILRRMDTAPAGVRICCIKFVARVIQVQTPGLIADPRRPEQNEISLALVPQDHPIIPPSNLEAEASGLLDRLLGVFQDDSSNALIVTSTLNALSPLIAQRASVSNKTLSTILNYNPLRTTNSPLKPRDKVQIKSNTRTTISFLLNFLKRNTTHILAPRLQAHIERLRQSLVDMLDPNNQANTLKRAAPDDPIDGLDEHKRQRVEASVNGAAPSPLQPNLQYPPLPPGPVSYAQLYQLTQDGVSTAFDVSLIPPHLVSQLLVPLLASIDKVRMDEAINAVRARYLSFTSRPPPGALAAANAATDIQRGNSYAPDDYGSGLEIDGIPLDDEPAVELGPFNLPSPPPLTEEETEDCSKATITRVFSTLSTLDKNPTSKPQKLGFNRLAASNQDRDAWITLLTRLASRPTTGLEYGVVKGENDDRKLSKDTFSLANVIREALYNYVLTDFRRRIDVAIQWLNEEWYNDRIIAKQREAEGEPPPTSTNYEYWMVKVLDSMIPYLDAKDKVLIRFLSEIPALGREVLERVKSLAKDPERVILATNALHYLILLRPPVREMCADALEDLWRNYEEAKASAAKLLTKWRPHVLQEGVNGTNDKVKAEGT